MQKKSGTYIAFDFGKTSIGVATGQALTQTATPLKHALKAKEGKPNWDQVAQLLNEWQPDALIVGLPLNMDDSDNEITIAARKFANKLHGRFNIEVHLVDERLSTFEAKNLLVEMHGSKALTKSAIDCFSAKLILESWLQEAS